MGAPSPEQLYVLFGPPGAGKNFVGGVMAERYSFVFYDADVDHTEEQIIARQEGRPFTEAMRERFFQVVDAKTREFLQLTNRLVIANAFINQRFREGFLGNFPFAKFVLIEANREERVKRILARSYHMVPPDLAIKMGDQFEPVNIPHLVVNNDGGREEVVAQLDKLIV